MPCYDDRDSKNSGKEIPVYAPSNLLCEACSILEEEGILENASKELRDWYEKHEEAEADRVRLEAAEKLTERERRLLGINLSKLQSKVK